MKHRKDKSTSSSAEKLTFRDYYGTSAMIAVEGVTASLMQSFFLLYLTDYSRLAAQVPVWAVRSWSSPACLMRSTILWKP